MINERGRIRVDFGVFKLSLIQNEKNSKLEVLIRDR